MFIKYSLWNSLLLFLSTIQLTITASNYRENLALRHPCITINKRLGPYIKWTEKLASTQYKVQKDACGQLGSGPACCTNEIMNSYALSLDTDLKTLFDAEFSHLTHLISTSKKQIDSWTKEYVSESRRITISSLETLFGTQEYRSNVHHSITTLFKNLADHQSSNDDVSKSAVKLFNDLIISSYRRFMTNNNHLIFDESFEKCLVNKAFDIEALPTQRELLYTLTSGASLIHILHTLFMYIDADIQQLKNTATINSNQCIQRYAREALCPMCISTSSSLPSSVNYDNNNINEPLCENDCRYVIKTCFDPINNPYVAFASVAQGYSDVIKEIQEVIVELKLVDRLSKLHIYLYDMVVNATNTQRTYTQLQQACPNSNEKPFSPFLSLPPIITERRELVTKWNNSLHFLLDQLQTSIDNLNTSLTQQITTDICSNSNYAVKSNRCTRIDQHMPETFSQWPIPSASSSTSSLNTESIRDQLNELKKKLTPVQEMMISLRPKKKIPLLGYMPDFELYDEEINTNDNDVQSPTASFVETYEHDDQESLSERLYNEIDGQTTRRSITTKTTKSPEEKKFNHSQSMTPNIRLYLIVFLFLLFKESRSLATEQDK